jgi:DME family drug/metabolite transporter
MRNTTIGVLQVLLAGVCWGTFGTLASFLPASLPSLAVGTLRLGGGALGIAVLLTITTKGTFFSRITKLPLKPMIIGALVLGMTQTMLYLGIRQAGVTVATMIFIGTPPLFSGLFSQLVRKEHQSRSWVISSLIIAIGCAAMAFSDFSNATDASLLIGSLCALAAGAGWTVVGTLLRDLQQQASPLESSFAVMGASALILSPFAISSAPIWISDPQVLSLILALGLISSALPYWLFTTGARRISASHAFLYGLSEPITASLLGMIILGERLSLLGATGYAAVVFGLLLFSYRELYQTRPIRIQR